MNKNIEEAVKGWIVCAMEIRGYTSWEIKAAMETAYQCQYGTDGISQEDAVNRYDYYRPKQETQLAAVKAEGGFCGHQISKLQ